MGEKVKKVFQTVVDEGSGDCTRAAFASLLDLEIEQVPHFGLYSSPEWFYVLYYFLWSLGWVYEGTINPPVDERFYKNIDECGINGYYYAGVLSRTFEGRVTHAVVVDRQGNVVHDPNPNQLWAGWNVFENEDVDSVYLIKERADDSEWPLRYPVAPRENEDEQDS